MPNSVELVKFRKLRVRDGVSLPSAWLVFVISGGCRCNGGVEGAEGGGEDSSKGRLGFGLSTKPSLLPSWSSS